MKFVPLVALSAALACGGSLQAATLAGQSIDGSFTTSQTVVTPFASPVVDPGTFAGVMQDGFGQVWDITVDVLPDSFVIDFSSPSNPGNGNLASDGTLMGIHLSGFSGAPTFALTSYSCSSAGFSCGAFGPGPSIDSLSSTSSTFDVNFSVLRDGESYTFGEAVPEPKSWALMLLGVGLLGGALRSRRGHISSVV